MSTGNFIATLVLFVLSIIFVIRPVRIPIGDKHFSLNLLTAPILVIALLWASQCLGATEIRDGIVGTDGIKPYNILIVLFSFAYMSITLDVTGVTEAAAHWVSNASGPSGLRLYTNFYLMVTALSAVLGNDPVILSGTLFLLSYTGAMDLDSKPWLMSEFTAVNTASMILFVGNPTNGVICEGFGIPNAAFTAYTIFPFIACSATCLAVLLLQYKPHQINLKVVEGAEAWKCIKDPISAVVGSILLGGCLITTMVVSFLAVDLWKIALPFAGAKFVFETCWDLYRTRSNNVEGEMLRSHAGHMTFAGNNEVISSQSYPPITSDPANLRINSRLDRIRTICAKLIQWAKCRQPALFAVLTRLPFGFIPFAFSQFILIEALANQGWINVFTRWLVIVSGNQMFPTIWIVGVMGIVLCNIAGTNIGATILLTKIVRAASLSPENTRAAGIALALASNIGAINFVFSASLTGILWKHMIDDHDKKNNCTGEDANGVVESRKGTNKITQREFAKWNLIPLLAMTSVGLAVVSAEMAVLYRPGA